MNRLKTFFLLLPALAACGDKSGTDTGPGTTDTDTDTQGTDTDTETGPTTDTHPTLDVDVYINEIMASNATIWADETGAHPDWVEIWNGTDAEVDLSGWFLTDDDTWTDKWAFPPGTKVPAGGFLMIACDGDVLDGPLHANFVLNADGEYLGLFGPLDQGNPRVDEVDYPLAAIDVSWARQPDGGEFADDTSPTPDASNN